MKKDDVFPSSYLKVDDLKGKQFALTIADVQMGKVGDDNKPVMTFKETNKTFGLNKTNWNILESLFKSDDSDNWRGRKIFLKPDMTTFQGKPTPCIRVHYDLPEHVQAQAQAQGQSFQAPVQVDTAEDPFGEKIPF